MATHSVKHEAAGYPLPVPWMGVTDFHRSHKDKTVESLKKPYWQGAWQLHDDDHIAIFHTDVDRVALSLFGVEDVGAADKVRRETCGLWGEEPAPATTGHGIDETTWNIAITSQRVPTHAKVAMFTTNYPEKEHWTWQRMNPGFTSSYGLNPNDASRMWFRIPKGDNPYVSQQDRDEWAHALRDRPDLVARLIEGRPGAVQQGKAVAVTFIDGKPMGFNETRHIAGERLRPIEGEPLRIGQDGGHCPATIIGQPYRGEIRILASLVPPQHAGMKQQYEYNVLPWLREYAPWALRESNMILGIYDQSLPDDESDSERNPLDVCQEMLGGRWQPGPKDWDKRKEILFNALTKPAVGSSFEAALKIDPTDGLPLIEALGGAWYYPTDRNGNLTNDKPKKPNHPHEDIGDAFIYFLYGVLPEIGREKPTPLTVVSTHFDARVIQRGPLRVTQNYDPRHV